MKRFLHWLVDFLDRKFPDKVVVRESDYKALVDVQVALKADVDAMQNKMSAIEMNLLNVNQAMGMTIPKMGMLER